MIDEEYFKTIGVPLVKGRFFEPLDTADAPGAVIVNDSTDYRLDVMPFGGTKQSGIGREGIPSALLEMTETRVACFNF